MSYIKELLLNVNQMKRYAADIAREVTIDVTRFGVVDESKITDAAMARYMLDKLLLDEIDLNAKWGQPIVYDVETELIIFRNKDIFECFRIMRMDSRETEFDWVLPDNQSFDWDMYFEKCKFKIV